MIAPRSAARHQKPNTRRMMSMSVRDLAEIIAAILGEASLSRNRSSSAWLMGVVPQ